MFQRWVTRSPRIVAGVWFAVAGVAPMAVFFLQSIIQTADAQAFLQVIVLPLVAVGLVGSWLGAAIVRRPHGVVRTFLRGMAVALGSSVLFAFLFSIVDALTQPAKSSFLTEVVAKTWMVVFTGLALTGWIVLPIGGVAGLLLHLIARGGGASK